MSTKIEGQPSHHDLIDDIIESPAYNPISLFLIDGSKVIQNRNYSNLPSVFNRSKFEQTDNSSTITLSNELRERLHLALPRSNQPIIMMSNDERRKEIDLILKHLHDGKLLTTMNDDRPFSEVSESPIQMLSKFKGSTTLFERDEESKNNMDVRILNNSCVSYRHIFGDV